ncbi:hypothetical protein BKA62DRAFT_833372 [Auriculariales sp. MPI-PUGE-AT-0066]|nr:hypothetical protein BKA62DRAFT_833372 [Auriculariales sp. MPI-PUGE-AT-0066]
MSALKKLRAQHSVAHLDSSIAEKSISNPTATTRVVFSRTAALPSTHSFTSASENVYRGDFLFDTCPKAGFGNDTSGLIEFDHASAHTLALPNGAIEVLVEHADLRSRGVLLYKNILTTAPLSTALRVVWNGLLVEADAWVAADNNPSAYFEFHVKNPGADSSGVQMVLTSALLVGLSRIQRQTLVDPDLPYTTSICTQTPISDARTSYTSMIATRSATVSPGDLLGKTIDNTPESSISSPSLSRTTLDGLSLSPTSHSSSFLSPTSPSCSQSSAASAMQTFSSVETSVATSAQPSRAAVTGTLAGLIVITFVLILLPAALLQQARRRRKRMERQRTASPFPSSTPNTPDTTRKKFPALSPSHQALNGMAVSSEPLPVNAAEEHGFRDFYSAMQTAGLTVQNLLEQHRVSRNQTADLLSGYQNR